MPWKRVDKAAALYLLVELAAKLEPDEVFQCLVHVGKMTSDRFDPTKIPTVASEHAGLAACLRRCLQEHGF